MSDTPIYDKLVQELGNPFKRKNFRVGGEAKSGTKMKSASKKGR